MVVLCVFSSGFLDRYFYFAAAPYLKTIGVEEQYILRLLSFGQIPEIIGLLMLGLLLRRLGFRTIMMIGALAHLLRFAIMTFSDSQQAAIAATFLHGMTVALFFAPAMMCFDRLCPRHLLSGAFLLFMFISSGLSGMLANLIGGLLFDAKLSYSVIWCIPLLASLIPVFLLIAQYIPKLTTLHFTPQKDV